MLERKKLNQCPLERKIIRNQRLKLLWLSKKSQLQFQNPLKRNKRLQ